MGLEADLRELMERACEADFDLAERLSNATALDPEAVVDGVSKGVLTTTDLLRIRGRLDGLREAILALAREVESINSHGAGTEQQDAR
jgi:hypothetical protein